MSTPCSLSLKHTDTLVHLCSRQRYDQCFVMSYCNSLFSETNDRCFKREVWEDTAVLVRAYQKSVPHRMYRIDSKLTVFQMSTVRTFFHCTEQSGNRLLISTSWDHMHSSIFTPKNLNLISSSLSHSAWRQHTYTHTNIHIYTNTHNWSLEHAPDVQSTLKKMQ